jgi:hypothetical protein
MTLNLPLPPVQPGRLYFGKTSTPKIIPKNGDFMLRYLLSRLDVDNSHRLAPEKVQLQSILSFNVQFQISVARLQLQLFTLEQTFVTGSRVSIQTIYPASRYEGVCQFCALHCSYSCSNFLFLLKYIH